MVVNVQVYCSFIGTTGWNNHTRDFLSNLDHDIVNVKVTNFSVPDNFEELEDSTPFDDEDYIVDKHRELLHEQLLWDGDSLKRFPIYSHQEDFKPEVNLVFAEANHHLFYQPFYDDTIPKIAYTVWETTKLPQKFFEKLLEFDELWVPSEWQKECHIEQGYPRHKIKVVNEGINQEFFSPQQETFRGTFQIHNNQETGDVFYAPIVADEGKPYITPWKPINKDNLFTFHLVGRWSFRKSTKEIIQTFLDTFDKDEPVQLAIAVDNFDSPEDEYTSTEERLEKYGLEDDRILIVPFMDRELYYRKTREADVLVSCSRGEGWNLPLIEAMASGVPVIYSKCGGQLEYVGDLGMGVDIIKKVPAWKDDLGEVYEPDFKQLSTHMREMYYNYREYKLQALENSIPIRKEFDWKLAGRYGTQLLTRIRKFSTELNPTYVTHVRPHENLESIKDNWMPKVNKVEGKFIKQKFDWDDVFVCNGKDAFQWGKDGNGNPKSFDGDLAGFGIFMRNDIFPEYHLGNTELEMLVNFYDMDSDTPDSPVYTGMIRPGNWVKANRRWFTRWRVTVEDTNNGTIYFEYKLDSLKGKKVLIFGIFGLGDSIAWFPYAEEFRKKHDCEVYYNGGYRHWFEDHYPNINWIDSGDPHPNCHLAYEIGWNHMNHDTGADAFKPMDELYTWPNDGAPRNYQQIELQASSADTLGIEYTGTLIPKATIPKSERKIKEKYVTICTQSTTQAKYWNYGWNTEKIKKSPYHFGDGWNDVIKYLGDIGYKVVVLNQHRQYGSPGNGEQLASNGAPDDDINKQIHIDNGDIEIWNKHDFRHHENVIDKTNEFISLEDRLIDLKYADFHIGLNSGLSWVAQLVDTPVIAIYGLHPPRILFPAVKEVHQTDPNVCTDCALEYPFVRGNWANCPKHSGTSRAFECTSTITPNMVIDKIKEYVDGEPKESITFPMVSEFQYGQAWKPYDNEVQGIGRVKWTPQMIGGYLVNGLVVGMFNWVRVISRNSETFSVEDVGKRLNKKVSNDIETFKHSDEDTTFYKIFSEYVKFTGKNELINTPFDFKNSKKAMQMLYDRVVDLLIMGDYIYFPKPDDNQLSTAKGRVPTPFTPSSNNVDAFTKIYEIEDENNSPCGVGSLYEVVKKRGVIEIIQNCIKKYDVKSVSMIGCGIFGNWEYEIDYKKMGVDYHGYELVPDEVERNKKEFPEYEFSQFDMTKDVCRKSDLIITREVIQHLSMPQVISSLKNFKKSGSKYLLITNWDNENNLDISPADYLRGFSMCTLKNLEKYPYNVKNVIESWVEVDLSEDGLAEWDGYRPLWGPNHREEDMKHPWPKQYLTLVKL